jgi:hypothetical protein
MGPPPVHVYCPVVGCRKRKDQWSHYGCHLPDAFTLPVDERLVANSDLICPRCMQRHNEALRNQVLAPFTIDALLAAVDLDNSRTLPTTPPPRPLSPPPPLPLLPRLTPAPHFPLRPTRRTPIRAVPITLGQTTIPFTSHPLVTADLYANDPSHPGLSFWRLDDDEFPLGAQPTELQPPLYDEVTSTTTATYEMPVVAFRLPQRTHWSVEATSEYRERRRRRLDDDVLSYVREGQRRADRKRVITLYQKDIEEVSAWPRPQEGEDASLPSPPSPPSASNSPFNTQRFSLHPHNLCCLMRDHPFAGFSSPSYYIKVPGSFFCLHVEQLFAPFYNICYDGSTTWWVVHREDRHQLDEYLVQRARQWYGVDDGVELSPMEREAIKGLLYTKAVVFHPDDVVNAGVRLIQVVQDDHTVVVGDGDVVHFGMVTHNADDRQDSRSVNEAINFVPLQWLTTGLPRLVAWLQWLRDFWIPTQHRTVMTGEAKGRLREAMRDTYTNHLIAHHCAPRWTHEFLTRLRDLLTAPTQPNDPHHATRTAIAALLNNDAAVLGVLGYVTEALTVLDEPLVHQWLMQHC